MFKRYGFFVAIPLIAGLTLSATPQAFAQGGQTWITQKITQTTTGYLADPVASDGSTLIAAGGYGPAFFTHTSGSMWGGIQFIGYSLGPSGCNAAGVSAAQVVGNTAVVGLLSPCNTGVPGQVAVFTRAPSSGSWTQAQMIVGSAHDFGSYVGFDGTNLVTPAIGGVRIYHDVSGTWTSVQQLTYPQCQSEYTALGGDHIIIGLPSNTSAEGSACIYQDTNGTWALQQVLTPTDGSTDFGWAIAIDNDTALVTDGVDGCPCQVDVFTDESGTWVQTQTIKTQANFNIGLAVQGNRMMIGSSPANDTMTYYTRTGPGGMWTQVTTFNDTWTDPQTGQDAGYGYSVAFAGSSLIVGTEYENAIYSYTPATLSLATLGPGSVKQGAKFTVQAIATNGATSASPALTINVPAPTGAALDSATAVGGSCTTSASQVTCAIAPISANGGTATVNVTLSATGAAGTSIATTATVQGADPSVSSTHTTSVVSSGGGGGGGGKSGGGGGGATGPLALLALLGLAIGFQALRRREMASRGGR